MEYGDQRYACMLCDRDETDGAELSVAPFITNSSHSGVVEHARLLCEDCGDAVDEGCNMVAEYGDDICDLCGQAGADFFSVIGETIKGGTPIGRFLCADCDSALDGYDTAETDGVTW